MPVQMASTFYLGFDEHYKIVVFIYLALFIQGTYAKHNNSFRI